MIRTYDKLTIKQFLQCKAIADMEQDPIMRKCKMLAEITGKPLEEIEAMPIMDLIAELKEFENIGHFSSDAKLKLTFKIKGQRFKCIWKQQQFTTDQYIDISHYAKDESKLIDNIHNILAAMCRRKTWYGRLLPYDGSEHKEIADLLYNNMLIIDAYPIMVFFCDYSVKLTDNIQTFLANQVDQTKKTFIANGVGLQ